MGRSLGTGRRFHCTPDQENTLIFRINQIRMQSKPYRTWPVPRVLSLRRSPKLVFASTTCLSFCSFFPLGGPMFTPYILLLVLGSCSLFYLALPSPLSFNSSPFKLATGGSNRPNFITFLGPIASNSFTTLPINSSYRGCKSFDEPS